MNTANQKQRLSRALLYSLLFGLAAHGLSLTNVIAFHDNVHYFFSVGATYSSGRWFLGRGCSGRLYGHFPDGPKWAPSLHPPNSRGIPPIFLPRRWCLARGSLPGQCARSLLPLPNSNGSAVAAADLEAAACICRKGHLHSVGSALLPSGCKSDLCHVRHLQ